MKKFYDKVCELLPIVWGVLWSFIITIGSIALLITIVKWFLTLVGVM